jgi:CubicO group peptidase (beta-lactamase class C family)
MPEKMDKIGRDTIFPTASMSKWITANGVMNLVQEGKLDLDRPVSDYLTRWQLPQSEFDNDKVTVRLLLSHMSGLTDGLGFGDYGPEETVPALEESLSRPRDSGDREVEIKLGREPDTKFQYSGGYLLLQLLVEEVSGETFDAYLQRTLFEPLEMSRSTFSYIGGLENVSSSYDADGQAAPLYRYTAKGATGFASSVADITRFFQSQLAADSASNPLRQNTIASMREPQANVFGAEIWGLGTILYAPTESGDYVFGHDGQNDPAINAAVRVNPETGDALICLVSGGGLLATRLGYEWVLWQTGLADVLHIDAVIGEAMPMFMIGRILILLIAVGGAWFRRRHRITNG